jgi:cold shock CspA family protein/ribosome-associated translation inhibitor RaiA
MQVPVQIDFRGEELSPRLRQHIEDKVAALESRFGRITAGRVVLKSPSGHHRSGGLYEVGVHLTLPEGRLVNVERTPTPDERFGDPLFAIDDAFKRARRQLQDEVGRMDRKSKQRQMPPIGTVVRLDPSGEFGFLATSDGDELYFHRNSVLNGGFAKLHVGTRVTFAEEAGEEGPQASTVRIAARHGMRL